MEGSTERQKSLKESPTFCGVFRTLGSKGNALSSLEALNFYQIFKTVLRKRTRLIAKSRVLLIISDRPTTDRRTNRRTYRRTDRQSGLYIRVHEIKNEEADENGVIESGETRRNEKKNKKN